MSSKLNKLRTALCGLLLLVTASVSAQSVKGTVVDNTGYPVPGAAVVVAGTTIGTATDFDGNYVLSDVPADAKLTVSFIGYATQTVDVAGRSTVDFTLKDDTQELEDVVVVGYGTMKKDDLTGSVSSVSTESLNAKGAPSVMENLQGATPGVNITQSSGRAGGSFDIEIRGKSSINSSTTPLYVVDGVMCDDIDWLNPQDIERIDVLKDASSTAIYGSRATAGVVMVTTKSGSSVSKSGKKDPCEIKTTITYDGYYGWTKAVRMPDFMDGQEFYNYRFLKFLTDGSSANGLLSQDRRSYKMEGSAFRQGMLYDNDGNSVMKQMLANGTTYDWPSLVTSDGQQQNHYLAVSGSSEKINYHIGAGFNQQKGLYDDDTQERLNFKGSIDAKINKLVSVGFNVNMARQENTYANDDAIQDAYRMNPYMIPYYLKDQYDKDGSWHTAGQLANFPGNSTTLGTNNSNQFTDAFNPLMQMMNASKERETWRLLGNFYVQLDILKGLNFKTTFSPNYTYYREGYYSGYEDETNPGHVLDVTSSSPYIQIPMTDDYTWSTASYETNRSFQWTWDNVINWNKTFADIHSVGLMGLFSMQQFNKEISYWYGTNTALVGSDWYAMQNLTQDSAESYTSYTENSMISYALRANYGLMGKYLLTATIRRDGSSKFAEDQRWGAFPSVAAAWRISEESFMDNTREVLSNLKLRLSYGVTGNNNGIGNYATQSTPTRYAAYPGMTTGYVSSGVVDQSLEWEKSKEFNVGVDFGFLSNRISGSVDWYTKKSTDLLYSVSLPLEAGLDSSDDPITLTTNVGSVRNQGIEVALTGVIIDTKDWNWTVSANFSTNKNEVLEINGTGDRLINTSSTKKQVENSLFVGESYNTLWGYKYAGVVSDRMMTVPNNDAAVKNGFTPGSQVREYEYYHTVYGVSEGQPMIEDANGDGTIDSNDRQFFRGDPKWTGTFTSNLSYKGWDLGFSIYAKIGQYAYSTFLEEYTRYSDRGRQHLNMDYYIPAGTLVDCDGVNADGTYVNPVYQEKTHYGKYPFPNNGSSSNGLGALATQFDEARCITDASYVKIKNITLGYSFPKEWLTPWYCSSLRLYFTVTNPFVFTDYEGFDPEWATASRSNDGPSTVSYQIGASIKF